MAASARALISSETSRSLASLARVHLASKSRAAWPADERPVLGVHLMRVWLHKHRQKTDRLRLCERSRVAGWRAAKGWKPAGRPSGESPMSSPYCCGFFSRRAITLRRIKRAALTPSPLVCQLAAGRQAVAAAVKQLPLVAGAEMLALWTLHAKRGCCELLLVCSPRQIGAAECGRGCMAQPIDCPPEIWPTLGYTNLAQRRQTLFGPTIVGLL